MKIAMIGHKRIPSREGGIERVVEEMSIRMVKLGHSVTLYNRKGHHVCGQEFDEKSLQCQSSYCGVRMITVPTIDKKGFSALSSSILASWRVLWEDYDVIHYHAEGPCAMLWLPHLKKIKTVATIHGLDWQRAKWGGFATKYLKFGEKIAAKYADEIIVLSRNVQKYFKETYNRDTHFIPNGIVKPVNKKAELIKDKWHLVQDSYILYLGRIVPEKGAHYLIKAYKGSAINKKLVIAGGSSDTTDYFSELKSLANGDGRIVFTGFVEGLLLEELYSNAYLYVLPSDLEGMPLSLLEAMSYGNCCLTSDIPECSEVILNSSPMFKKSDVVDLKNKLQMLCNNPEIVKHYKKASRERALTGFDWDKIVTDTLGIYK